MTVILDPDLLIVVDRYIEEHQAEGVERSRIADEALRLWCRERPRQAMRTQYLAPRFEEELAEEAGWARIRDAICADFVRRYDEHDSREA